MPKAARNPMPPGKKQLPEFVHYLPGLAVLVLGMFALYASLSLIGAQDRIVALMQYDSGPDEFRARQIQGLMRQLGHKETILYWSVIGISFAGFILTLLNADRVRELKNINRERKETLKLLENRLAAMEATYDGIGIIDRDNNLTYMNRALRELHGIPKEETEQYLGRSWHRLYSEKGQRQVEEHVMPVLKAQGYWRGESPVRRRNGEIVYAELSLTRLADGGIIGTARDITERRRIEREHARVQEQFYQAQKMEAVGRLAGGIAHDFNNILAAMNGYAEFLKEDFKKDTPQHKFACNILQSGRQARDLVDQMLAFSRRGESETKIIDLRDPMAKSLAMLEASLPKTIEVEPEIGDGPACISGNATRIAQVIMNLCVNARDAMGEGHGVLKVGLRTVDARNAGFEGGPRDLLPETEEIPAIRIEEEEDERTTRLMMGTLDRLRSCVHLYVEDTGSGMSREIMAHIFEPFFTTKPVDKGTGLGLATVHGVVAAHRGAMAVRSRLGRGTRFDLYFPQEEPAAACEQAEEKAGPRGSGLILLVEDQAAVRDMMLEMLERLGYEASACVSGLEALACLREDPGAFDLVITDQNMPKMTGLDLIGQVHGIAPDLPFILLSGYSQQRLEELMRAHPAVRAILSKPVTREKLARTIDGVLGEP